MFAAALILGGECASDAPCLKRNRRSRDYAQKVDPLVSKLKEAEGRHWFSGKTDSWGRSLAS